jgi:hypothetical protein
MIIDLEKTLGRALTVKQVAEFLNINEKTVRERYQDFKGIKIGRHYRFFERSIIYAIQKQTEKQVHSTGEKGKNKEGESFSDTEGSESVGSQNEKAVRRRVERQDKHGLLVD